jgi:hypothetical protein
VLTPASFKSSGACAAEPGSQSDEVYHATRAEHLASRLSVAPPVPSKLPDFDERGGVSAGADAEETEGTLGPYGLATGRSLGTGAGVVPGDDKTASLVT